MKMVRTREEIDPEAEVLEQVVGDSILDEAILEPRRESLRARRRRALMLKHSMSWTMATVMAPMTLDEFLYPTCLKSLNCHIDRLSHFVLPGHLTKMSFFGGQIYFWINISILRDK